MDQTREDQTKAIDIIIPIYNAFGDLTKCIASIFENTDLSLHRLILINDKSSDLRIIPYLKTIEGNNILVINNEQNQGFSFNVNLGMQSFDRDVLLLNSDTIVTTRWIDKIYSCAYSDPMIGTVTPLSNSATLASYPIFGIDNPIPSNVTVKELASLVERVSLKSYPKIPLAVGFCMFIKREVINAVGLFDTQTFGKGYGEENDFCYRAELYGYKHVLSDDSFVYHKGTGSFLSSEKEQLINAHVNILEKRYSAFMNYTHLYCIQNPHQYIRDNINLYIDHYNGKKNILYILHADFSEDAENSIGGTQLHVQDLTMHLKKRYNIFVLVPCENSLKLTVYTETKSRIFFFDIKNKYVTQVFYDAEYKKNFMNILNAFQINIIHIHHIQGLSLDIFTAAKELKIPILLSIHDYYFICPTIFLYNTEKKLCTHERAKDCKMCLLKNLGISDTVDYIDKWDMENRRVLDTVSNFIFPSKSASTVFLNFYPEIIDRYTVIPHGLELNKTDYPLYQNIVETNEIQAFLEEININTANENKIAGWGFFNNKDNSDSKVYIEITDCNNNVHICSTTRNKRLDVDDCFGGNGKYIKSGFEAYIDKNAISSGSVDIRIILENNGLVYKTPLLSSTECKSYAPEGRFNIAFIGGLSEVKGSSVVYDLIKHNDNYNWFIFGNVDRHEALYDMKKHNLYNMGTYKRNDIAKKLIENNIKLICIFSKCSETFCYTLSEALLAKIPVLVFKTGALEERVKELECGWLMDPDSTYQEILLKIEEIRTGDVLEHLKNKITSIKPRSIIDMANDYDELYKLYDKEISYGCFEASSIYKASKRNLRGR